MSFETQFQRASDNKEVGMEIGISAIICKIHDVKEFGFVFAKEREKVIN